MNIRFAGSIDKSGSLINERASLNIRNGSLNIYSSLVGNQATAEIVVKTGGGEKPDVVGSAVK